jgi:hypothetical protein
MTIVEVAALQKWVASERAVLAEIEKRLEDEIDRRFIAKQMGGRS